MSNKLLPTIAIIISMIIWSISGIAIKHALVSLPPLTMIIFRFTPAVLLMLIVGLVRQGHSLFALQLPDKKDLPLFVFAGVCQPFLYYLLETFTYRALNSPTIAEALLSTSPLLSPIFAAILLRERVTRNNIWGILISTLGMFALLFNFSHPSSLDSQLSVGSYWGIPLAFAAVTAAVTDSVIMRRLPAKYNPLTIIFYAQLVSLCLFYPLWFFREGPEAVTAIDWSQLADIHSPLAISIFSVGYLTVFASVIAFILFCYALRQIGVTEANAFNNIRPAFTALWMLLFFGEQLPLVKWIGIGLIIFGLFVCQKEVKHAKN